ncbi:hypothetical protein M5689_015622 [Euphorbia peplus]|nr:hypothetical protein M5689_015622 [Euphorbia peplus]
MGNCLVHQEKLIKIIKPDGKILEYQTPKQVHHILSDFSGFALSHQPTFHHLLPNTQLIGGNFYYLLPLPLKSTQAKKKVRFTVPEEEESKKETGLVRIKVIISKQELQEMLQNGGISVNYMVSKLQNLEKVQKNDLCDEDDEKFKSWKPELESIPEFGEVLL